MSGIVTVVLRDPDAVARRAADQVEQLVRTRPAAVLGLAAGRTPAGLYAELARRHREDGLSFARVTTFHLDEYVGLVADDPRSFASAAREQVCGPWELDPTRAHVPAGDAPDLDAECARYEALLASAGGIDLQVLGIGTNGHVAFNEPGSPAGGRTRVVELAEQTRRANGLLHADDPRFALTMGIATILSARALLLLATGPSKADALRAALEGPVTEDVPASLLRRHPALTVLADEDAAAQLERRAGTRPTADDPRGSAAG